MNTRALRTSTGGTSGDSELWEEQLGDILLNIEDELIRSEDTGDIDSDDGIFDYYMRYYMGSRENISPLRSGIFGIQQLLHLLKGP
jgi:hypothetical protein